ncbi:protein translocase subunit SecF [Candidatus Uhrbacteria bacterium]|nr:protein translocase subunit SecF [Candidatus Uhrbacteria bacterium]
MNIIKLRNLWFTCSAVLISGSIICLAMFGLKQGIDFTGGTLMSLRFEGERPTVIQVEEDLKPFNLGSVTIQPVGEKDINLRLKNIEEAEHQEITKVMKEKYGNIQELEYNAIGPAIGEELRQKSVTALVIIFLAILGFIAWSFRNISAPVASWKYGLIVIFSAFHDVIVPIGLFAILGKFHNVEIGTPFIAAILTIMGYSINDTIVIFDRIRENLQKSSGTFEEIVERSLHQTMLRSFNTSMTTMLTLISVYFFGGESVRDFSLALIVGIATGTYSSIFIAPPILVAWNSLSKRNKK